MLGPWVHPATPVPSSDHDVPSSPSGHAKHAKQVYAPPSVATPPPSSPTVRDHPFSLFAEALEHAASRQAAAERAPVHTGSPVKRAAVPPRRSVTVRADPDVGIRQTPRGQVLQANYTHTLVVGRAKVLDRAAASEISPTFMGTQPAVCVPLPGTAKHVSRIHALIRWVPFTSPVDAPPQAMSGTFVVRIVGQNGLIVNGERRRPGQVLRLMPNETQLDFFGVRLRFVAPAPTKAPVPRARAPVSGVSPTKRAAPLPPSSPVLRAASPGEDSAPESPTRAAPAVRTGRQADAGETVPRRDEPVAVKVPKPVPAPRVAESEAAPTPAPTAAPAPIASAPAVSSAPSAPATPVASASPAPATPAPADREPLAASSQVNATPTERAPKASAKDVSAAPRAKSEKRAETPKPEQASLGVVRGLVQRLAPTYDLAGLLAGAIVFHRTATISTSEAVRSVLSSNPGMLRGEAGVRASSAAGDGDALVHGEAIAGWETDARFQAQARRAWHEVLEQELQSAPMFGVIQRPGKDTTGKPLECWYHYDKENDPDVERAQNLGAFVKPMRNVVRSQKPIFWKKSEYSRATSGSSTNPQDDLLPYSPRNYYSSDTDDGERRKRSATPSAKRAKWA